MITSSLGDFILTIFLNYETIWFFIYLHVNTLLQFFFHRGRICSQMQCNKKNIFYFTNYNRIRHHAMRKKAPVRKTPVPDRSSSEKSSDKSAPLRPIENSQNYQIWSRIDRVIEAFLFISPSYNARRKRVGKNKQTSKSFSLVTSG